MKLTAILIGLAAMAASLPATTILFGGGGGVDLGVSSQAFGPVIATGYASNGVFQDLYGKGVAGTGSEDGLGLVGDFTGDGEIYAKFATGAPAGDFIQLSIAGLNGPIFISMGSTGGDGWAVYGNNTAGTLVGASSALASFSGPGNDDGSEVIVTNATSYKYLDIVATSNNVLLQDLVYTSSVPEPGTLGIVGLGGVLIGLLRRKLRQN